MLENTHSIVAAVVVFFLQKMFLCYTLAFYDCTVSLAEVSGRQILKLLLKKTIEEI